MPQMVHLVTPDGVRYERIFGDAATDAQILAALRRPDVRIQFGRAATVVRKDAVFGEVVPHPDADSPWAADHPDTVVCVGDPTPDGGFRETRRLAGPPAKKEVAPTDTDGK